MSFLHTRIFRSGEDGTCNVSGMTARASEVVSLTVKLDGADPCWCSEYCLSAASLNTRIHCSWVLSKIHSHYPRANVPTSTRPRYKQNEIAGQLNVTPTEEFWRQEGRKTNTNLALVWTTKNTRKHLGILCRASLYLHPLMNTILLSLNGIHQTSPYLGIILYYSNFNMYFKKLPMFLRHLGFLFSSIELFALAAS